MSMATVRVYGELNDFLPLTRRQADIGVRLKDRQSVKDLVEAVGVPHPEIDLLLVNGVSADFGYLVQDGDRIGVYPRFHRLEVEAITRVRPESLPELRFLADAHLGKLAVFLRLLGFDTAYERDALDEDLARRASAERRALLTRDRGLLKRSLVAHGYYVREQAPHLQVVETLRHFDLPATALRSLERCLRCNGLLVPTPKAEVVDRLEPLTRRHFDAFSVCAACGQVYWAGSHFDRMQRFIDWVRQQIQETAQPAGHP